MAAHPADPRRRFAGLGLRAVSAGLLAPLAILVIHIGDPWFDLLLAAVALQMAREWGRMAEGGRIGGASAILAGVIMLSVLALWSGLGLGAILLGLGAAALGVLAYATWHGVVAPGWLAAGALALGGPILACDWLRGRPEIGESLLVWLFATVWATDIGAYLSGRVIGGPKLAPRISPNKTWAGLAGGMLAAAVTAALIGHLLTPLGLAPLGPSGPLLLLGAGAAVVAQVGDLAESAMKRHFGVKDSGGLIPGHGGVLDRIDGLLTLAPMTALAVWAGQQGWIGWPA